MRRYLTSAVEQGLFSILNLGVNLVLIRLVAPQDYGVFVFWGALGYVLASVQNAVSICHLQVTPFGPGFEETRGRIETIMAGVNLVFLAAVCLIALGGVVVLKGLGASLGVWAGPVYLIAFLAQQYGRALRFSRRDATGATVRTAAVLALAAAGLTTAAIGAGDNGLSADKALILLAAAYGLVALWGVWSPGALSAVKGLAASLRAYPPYARQSGWIFLGAASTEVLARFYVFAVAGTAGAVALATLSATQLLLRPPALLASSWAMAARPDLVARREAGDAGGLVRQLALAAGGGLLLTALWTAGVAAAWPLVTDHVFGGKYAGETALVVLWGVCAATTFVQVVINTGLQSIKAFKVLALANAGASLIAMGAILAGLKLAGPPGAVLGTVIGQAAEAAAMAILLIVLLRRGHGTAPR
ncbi:hypothetical protein P7B02_06395 [Caulobacter segnis]|uniref:hypothetical protein n=1 Tax=Caulobacter segnis TaxID=88688 RepID=UPI002410AD58|nr:hypothetical protein [Caulobacter segnis]MDG2521167.1 hypothetical protein [Caulobacter segnis]